MSKLHGLKRWLPNCTVPAACKGRSGPWHRPQLAMERGFALLLGLALVVGTANGAELPKAPFGAERGPGGQITLDVLTFNTFLLPVLPDSQDIRAPLMADHLKGYDVVLLQEAYSNRHREMVLDGLADDYPYQSEVLGRDRWLAQDGGVVILSKWPIEDQGERLFGPLCQSRDCWADKGVLYARINKLGRRFHVFATHLQSRSAGRAIRQQQMAIIRDFIDDLDLPEDEPVLIGGDLNTDRFTDEATGAFTRMLGILGAVLPGPPRSLSPAGRHTAGLWPVAQLTPAEASIGVARSLVDSLPTTREAVLPFVLAKNREQIDPCCMNRIVSLAALGFVEEGINVERQCEHLQPSVLSSRPCFLRAVPIEFQAVAIRVAQV